MTKRIKKPATGGRPSAAQAARIRDHILEVAGGLFLAQGYGGTSIEAIAKQAGISKRTFYTRFADKSDVFGAVVHHLVERLRPPPSEDAHLFEGTRCAEILEHIAIVILNAALRPEALALHRIITSESSRFPELAAIMQTHGARNEAITRIAALLTQSAAKPATHEAAIFAAEQFLHSVVAGPQQRALGMGTALSTEELKQWAKTTIRLFLHGWPTKS